MNTPHIYEQSAHNYLVELYDNQSLVAHVQYFPVFVGTPLAKTEYDGVVIVDDVEYIYVINQIVENYEDEQGDMLQIVYKHRENFQEVFEEYGLSSHDVDDVIEELITIEEN